MLMLFAVQCQNQFWPDTILTSHLKSWKRIGRRITFFNYDRTEFSVRVSSGS